MPVPPAPLAVAALLILAAAAPTAHAAAPPAGPRVTTDRPCYLDSTVTGTRTADRIGLSGSGFTPGAQFLVSLDATPLSGGIGVVDGLGNVSGSFTTSALAGFGRRERSWRLRVDEGVNSAATTFRTSDVYARFSPAAGDPSTLRVRWSAFGMRLDKAPVAAAPSVYLHYVRPNGKRRSTVRLGRAGGPCGRLAPTAKRRLFPFRPEQGLWRLQVDTNPRYRRGVATSRFVHHITTVRVRRASG